MSSLGRNLRILPTPKRIIRSYCSMRTSSSVFPAYANSVWTIRIAVYVTSWRTSRSSVILPITSPQSIWTTFSLRVVDGIRTLSPKRQQPWIYRTSMDRMGLVVSFIIFNPRRVWMPQVCWIWKRIPGWIWALERSWSNCSTSIRTMNCSPRSVFSLSFSPLVNDPLLSLTGTDEHFRYHRSERVLSHYLSEWLFLRSKESLGPISNPLSAWLRPFWFLLRGQNRRTPLVVHHVFVLECLRFGSVGSLYR